MAKSGIFKLYLTIRVSSPFIFYTSVAVTCLWRHVQEKCLPWQGWNVLGTNSYRFQLLPQTTYISHTNPRKWQVWKNERNSKNFYV